MKTLIPIIADTPSADPRLGFDSYATALAAAICGGNPAQFTIGIYGPWGSGKSSLLNAVARCLSGETGIITVFFDAWRYEGAPHIIVPLMSAIYSEINKRGSGKLTEKVKTALLSIVKSLTISLGPVSISGEELISADLAASYLDSLYVKPFTDMKAIGQALERRRIVVLIDDLDRCSSGKVVALLEAINLVMDVPGFVFVLALDYDILVKAVSERYPHASGHVFIEKMVQVPFRVPRLDFPSEGFLNELIPEWLDRSVSLPDGFEDIVRDVATLGLEANPRQIKRLINSVMVLLSIARDRSIPVDPRILAGLVGLQLRWPAEYGDFAQAVLADDPQPINIVSPEDQPGLHAYSERFFTAEITADALRPYLQLTQSVAVTEDVDGDNLVEVEPGLSRPAAEMRLEHRIRLTAILQTKGYVPRSANVYVHPSNPSFRIKFGKTVVRFEVRWADPSDTGPRWHLAQSLLLTKQYHLALPLVEDRVRMVREITKNGLPTSSDPAAAHIIFEEQLKSHNDDLRSVDWSKVRSDGL
jgi:energy-coupling factor transporter ATP-binding protein EcfA2